MSSTIWVIEGDARSLEYGSYSLDLGDQGLGFTVCV